jgi:hypothetical protein
MGYEEHSVDIHIDYQQSNYDGDCSTNCDVTFTNKGVHTPIQITYSEEYLGEIIPQLSTDIEAYLNDPTAWAKDIIMKGKDNWLKIRELEHDITEKRDEIERYRRYANDSERSLKSHEQKLVELKSHTQEEQ